MSVLFCNNNSMSAITSVPSGVIGGSMVLISTQTASSSSTISFASGIDSTYKEYVLKYINVHPSSDAANFQVNFRDGSTAYDATKTTSVFLANLNEDDSGNVLEYKASNDLAQSTNFQNLGESVGADNDQGTSGTLHLFDPSSTSFIKHFLSTTNNYDSGNNAQVFHVSGYINTSVAIDAVQFKFDSGNIDSGIIKLYGVT